MGVFGWLVLIFSHHPKQDTSLVEYAREKTTTTTKEERNKNGARDLVSDRVMAARYTRCAAAGTGRAGAERAESDVRSARVDVWTTIIDGVDWCVTRTNKKSDIIRGR